ncbi:unnamed protein product, partial [Rotaria magnacalcarata]
VKNHLFIFFNCLIENLQFEKQASNQLATELINLLEYRQDAKLQKQSGSKTSKLKGITKLDDANDAETKNSQCCTLIVTGGNLAKVPDVAGLDVIDRDRYGVYPLQDQDDSHIKGLVVNFIHYKWPNLLKHDYIEVFITSILKSMPEFEQWQTSTPNWLK